MVNDPHINFSLSVFHGLWVLFVFFFFPIFIVNSLNVYLKGIELNG